MQYSNRASDTIVIGGGTNGLACATRLAQSGRKVTLVEGANHIGGGAVTTEFAPGYKVSGLAHILHMLDPRVTKGMALDKHGLTLIASNLSTTLLGEDPLMIVRQRVIGLSSSNQQAWDALSTKLTRFANALAPFRQMTPPRPARGVGNDLAKLARLGLNLRRMGQSDFREFLRMILINVADVLEDDLTDDRLMGLIAFDTTLGAWLGPRSPNSLILLLNRLAGGALTLPRGGMGAVADAMQTSAQAAGVNIRTGAGVARIEIAADRASGVTLTSGETLTADLIISAINPRTTFEHLVGPRGFDTGLLRQSRNIRSRGGAAKLHLALTGTPDFKGADLKTRLVIAPSVNAVENAFNPVKYNEVPAHPVMEIILPSAHEPGMAPQGHHSLSAIVQFAPHAPSDPDHARSTMLANILQTLEDHAPGIGALITHSELLMPYDIAERYGMQGGNWHHGELAAEQMLFLRPFAGVAQYDTPLPGLWLAGAGSHPGGGISGASGWNAAERIIKVQP